MDLPQWRGLIGEIDKRFQAVRVLARAGLARPERPDRLFRALLALVEWDRTPAAGATANASRHPDETYIIDELGRLTFAEVNRRTNALANGLAEAGIKEGNCVAIMCRNHRYIVEAIIACSKLGADAVLLNTDFAGPQITDVVKREKARALIYDEEFAGLLAEAGRRRKRFVAWVDGSPKDPTIEQVISGADDAEPLPPERPGRQIILTSGTTGAPKGAARPPISSLDPVIAILSTIPLKTRETHFIVAPLFHSWGLFHLSMSFLLATTVVLRRRFDPERTLSTIGEHEVHSAPMVPVMLQRIMELPEPVRRRYDVSSLRAVPLSGSAIPGDLAVRFMDDFGDVVYNLYGSTEVGYASIATPEDLREAPGTAGRPPYGTVVKILDDEGREVPQGETGRIFVGSEVVFEGYTGGGSKEVVDGLMSSGDVGSFDEAGRLTVTGRADDMIVSGGENVFPREIEDLLARHDAIAEAAVIGVPDPKFGQRLKAFVVTRDGRKVTEEEVRDYIKAHLARFKVPREVEFLDELPRNPTGKVLKRVLAEREA
ncbi:MAG: AMP-binding protein [Actinomycetota bacterium]